MGFGHRVLTLADFLESFAMTIRYLEGGELVLLPKAVGSPNWCLVGFFLWFSAFLRQFFEVW